MSKAHSDFLAHGHNLSRSDWSSWYTAYQYAAEVSSPLLPLIDKGCDYAEKQQHVPDRCLRAAEKLYESALASRE